MKLSSLIVILALLPVNVSAQTTELVTPFQTGFKKPTSKRPRGNVSFGLLHGVRRPFSDTFSDMTFFGTKDFAHGELEEIDGWCDRCGTNNERFLYSGKFLLDRPGTKIGKPVAAVPGKHQLHNYEPLALTEPGPGDRITPGGPFFEAIRLKPAGFARRIAEWNAETGDIRIETRNFDTRRISSYTAKECRIRRTADLKLVECKNMNIALLLEGSRIVLASFEECGEAKTTPHARFKYGNATYYVVEFGYGSQNVYGLLVKSRDGWKTYFRPRDYGSC